MEGNQQYVEGITKHYDFMHKREALISGQNPFATILSCADSRITPEYAFDSGRGGLFTDALTQGAHQQASTEKIDQPTNALKSKRPSLTGGHQ